MSFISLCMAMETIVDGTSELLYRMRRSMALLCAEDGHHARKIYENVKLIYGLRSSIVHGGDVDFALIYDYLPYLRALVSRMVIKLVKLDVASATELQDTLVFMGFSDRNTSLKIERPLINVFTCTETMKVLKKKPAKKQ